MGTVELNNAENVVKLPDGANNQDGRRVAQRVSNEAIQHIDIGYTMPQSVTLSEMIKSYVLVQKGKLVAHVTPQRTGFLKIDEHKASTACSLIEYVGDDNKKRKTYVHNAWLKSDKKKTVTTLTFAPGKPDICSNPDGLSAVNIWRPIKRISISANKMNSLIEPFIEQIRYLFKDETEPFLDWMAHIEQKPEELPHYGWLHVAKHTGSGRNWMASVISRLWRGYVAPNVELDKLLTSDFNGQLSGRMIAIVDEIQEGGNDTYKAAQRLKSMVNPETRYINQKYGVPYTEFNACRWLVFSNHLNAIPINDTDRRWRCVYHDDKPREPEIYELLYGKLNNPEFINALGYYLSQRDISNFKAGERPPMTISKMKILDASKSQTVKNADEMIARWPSDIITQRDALYILTDGDGTKMMPYLRHAMTDVGAIQINRKIKFNGQGEMFWIIRNHEKWLSISEQNNNVPLQDEVSKARKESQKNWDANLILSSS
ncbi:DUF5906 domain-containing protein (plasmid) [Moellerella wisconsensis]|uniref:primase-helicase family protein n=1 Tax=Moellerella wisconsensis TaxID=158849 RepID=UPI001F4ED60D|nr:DUF5906 domain-containing protein [Moellerella wisconsensis]UNH29343.1 DUF5906 domain-containing protein [Moellerella wisconsensis]